MESKEHYWNSSDGLKIFAQSWAIADSKAVVCLVHGLGEHCSRYDELARFFNDNGISFISFDQRGHGRSEGKRGHSPSFELLLEDISLLLRQADKFFPGVPKFLYGHSMGGNLVLNYALRKREKLTGVISSSPWLKLAFEAPAIKLLLAKMVNGIYPAFTQASNLETAALCRNTAVVEAYNSDPLVHDKISSNLFLNMHNAGLWALQHANEFDLPLLIFHGSEDRITSAQATIEFSRKVKTATFKLLEGFYHESHNEPEKDKLYEFLKEWICSRI